MFESDLGEVFFFVNTFDDSETEDDEDINEI
jgi:hypothetical protein